MSIRWLFLSTFILLYGNLSVDAQTADILFKNITISNGLSQNSVVDIVQDNQGFMWFATQDGLNRYDGNEFKIFPISFDDITNPDNSKLGKLLIYGDYLWMITIGGRLEVMDLKTESITRMEVFPTTGDLIPSVSYIFLERKDRIWLGTENHGLYLLDGSMDVIRTYANGVIFENNILSNKINKIFKDSLGRIWVLTKDGINEISNGRIINHLEGINSNTMVEDADGKLWMGSLGMGIYTKTKDGKTFHPLDLQNNKTLPTDLTVESLIMDEKSLLWVGTYGRGLYIIDNKSGVVSHLMPDSRNPRTLGFQDILSIYRDRNNGIWIGTDGGGLSFYDESFKNFKILTSYNVPDNIAVDQIRAITSDSDGYIWFGTSGNGFSRYDPVKREFKPFHLKPYKKGINNYDRIVALRADEEGDLWVGTHGNGTLIMDRKSGEIKKWFTTEAARPNEKIPDNNIWCFVKENENMTWAGSRTSGLLLLDKNEGLIGHYVQDVLGDDNVRAITRVNDSTLALGYEKKGLHLFNINTGVFESIADQFIKENLDRIEFKSLHYDNHLLWAGTSGKGLMVTDLKSGNSRIFTVKEGLPNNMIYSLLTDSQNKIWASTNSGIFRLEYKYDKENTAEIVNIDLFTQENGLQSNEFNTGASHKCQGGLIYLGGINGMNYFDPDKLIERNNQASVIISEALIENMPFEGEKIINYTDLINLPYSKNSIAFSYAALDFNSLEKSNYSYKLERYDDDWVYAGTRNYTAYTNLTPGDYMFKVRLSNGFGGESPITTLGVSIAAPFWLTIWFNLLVILVCIAIIYFLNQNRIHQLLILQKVKDSISADLHDDLGSRLTTIHLLSAISQPEHKNNPKLIQVLQKIEKEIQASSEALDEIVWNIKINDESLIDMIANIRRHVSEVLEDCNISYTINTPDELGPSFKMKMQKRRDLYLICKELITNVRKHAAAKHIEINIKQEKNMLLVSVKDDGKGFCQNAKTHRNGLSNLKERIAKWSGNLHIASTVHEGSLFEVRIPFDRTNYFKKMIDQLFFK